VVLAYIYIYIYIFGKFILKSVLKVESMHVRYQCMVPKVGGTKHIADPRRVSKVGTWDREGQIPPDFIGSYALLMHVVNVINELFSSLYTYRCHWDDPNILAC